MSGAGVAFGVDRVVRDGALLPLAARVGLVTNEAARLAGDAAVRSRVALLAAGVPIVRLFSPEHGLAAVGEDGAPMRDGVDATTGLPVVSLYGERFAPPAESLADLDLVLFDVPDVGARFYTYAWTLSHVLEACARAGTPLAVLDRPNPLGGVLAGAEGPMLDEATCASFIGRWSIPIRHALTLGELARLWAQTRVREARLSVVTCDGWRRDMMWPALALPWIPTSPAMPSFDAALAYPGTCLFEGTNLGVGRGTAHPFQQVGAPWLDAARVLDAVQLPAEWGMQLAATSFSPGEGPYAGQACHGVRLTAVDARRVRPVAAGLALLAAVVRAHPREFAWAPYRTAANPGGDDHFARIVGVRHVAPRLLDLSSPVTPALVRQWTAATAWAGQVREALLYE